MVKDPTFQKTMVNELRVQEKCGKKNVAFLCRCLIIVQLDSVVLCAGVQHWVDFKKLEEIDLISLIRVNEFLVTFLTR